MLEETFQDDLIIVKAVLSQWSTRGLSWRFANHQVHLKQYKMNEIINKFLLAGDAFMPKIHLRQDAALSKPSKQWWCTIYQKQSKNSKS